MPTSSRRRTGRRPPRAQARARPRLQELPSLGPANAGVARFPPRPIVSGMKVCRVTDSQFGEFRCAPPCFPPTTSTFRSDYVSGLFRFESDLLSDDFREFLQNLLMLQEERLYQIEIFFDARKALAILIEVGYERCLVLQHQGKCRLPVAAVADLCHHITPDFTIAP